ncbi:hypothetical protein DFP72DRAFT_839726 [Ephemerocybe angulata]|uniref:Uncharacterized protein n=1 Tax=Ephemerocybe angulata TaxID=980116 RepID=A0A8H6IHT1_9AGAR|nr:hypothetical protein DFP72DRAFT_839726 [Tulosesus angulatus]
MAALVVSPLVELFRWTLQPIAPFTWFGFPISTLDVVATFRLCLVLRQIRELIQSTHIAKKLPGETEEQSFAKRLATTLLVVYGGEAITAPMLGIPPSFMVSGIVPAMYATVQAIVDALPFVPEISAQLEIPLSIVDGITRAYLLCNLIPPTVTTNSSSLIASSPWTLLVTSLITANAGFFFVNLFSFLNPTPLSVQTPPELKAYGWTTTDLWCAPAGTALYALLTHAQPFWTDLHTLIYEALLGSGATQVQGEKPTGVQPVDPETARAIVAVLLSGLFVGKTAKNFGLWPQPVVKAAKKVKAKAKTQ